MNIEIGFYGIGALLVLLVLRMPVALALIAVSFGGIVAMLGMRPALGVLANTPYSFVASWTMSAVPMFLLMGFVAYHAGLTGGLFAAAKAFLRRVPGGLGIASIAACSGFASVSGSSLACCAAMGRIAIPEMIRAGYKPSIAAGSIAAGGTIGALIPPSILMIIYGIFAETSITQVFIGGVSIGLMTAFAYAMVILAIAWLRPDLIPRTLPAALDREELSKRQAVLDVWPVGLLVVIVLGGLFSGFFSATEAGAVGALGAILVALLRGTMTMRVLRVSLMETLVTTASLLVIGLGAAMFTRFLGISGMSGFLSSFVSGSDLGYFELMLIIVLIYLALGTFMEPFGAMMVTLPILLPILHAEGISLVWFGVLVVKLLEIGMITPPVGLNVFVIKNVASRYVSVVDVFKGVLPFILADLVLVAVMIVFPGIILFLPRLL